MGFDYIKNCRNKKQLMKIKNFINFIYLRNIMTFLFTFRKAKRVN